MTSRLVVDDLVETFKTAWETADAEGQAGRRTKTALSAVLDQLLLFEGDTVVGQPAAHQNVVLFVGDGLPVYVEDTISGVDLRDQISSPIQRAVTIARLRTAADLLEQDGDE